MEQKDSRQWRILAAGTFLMLFMGLIYAWSIFRKPLGDIFTEWTPTDLSLTFTISMAMFCLGGFVCGKLSAHIRHRWIFIICAFLVLAGFLGLSFYDPSDSQKSLIMLYVCYGVLGGFSIGMSYNAIISSVTKWFPGKAGMASGVLLMGFGLGGLVLGGFVSFLLNSSELSRVFVILGISMFLALLAGSFVIAPPKQPPADFGKMQKNANPCADYTVAEMLKTKSFWLFGCWMILISSGGLLVINSAAVISVAFGASAVIGLIVSIFNGAGRIILGTLFDRIGREKTVALDTLIMILAGITLLIGAVNNNPALIFIGLPLVGIAYGGAPAITSATVLSFYGSKNFGANLGIMNFSIMVSAMIGPLISSKLQEASGGEYTSTFIMIIVLAVIGLFVTFVLSKASRGLEPR